MSSDSLLASTSDSHGSQSINNNRTCAQSKMAHYRTDGHYICRSEPEIFSNSTPMAMCCLRTSTQLFKAEIVQHQKFDPDQRLLHRFYEPLVLLSVLDPTRGVQNDRSSQASEPDSLQDAWHKFLDQLSWICDYEPGGKTVSAVAVETTPSGPIYWLAANTNPKSKAVPHLKWVLQQLESLYGPLPLDIEELESKITNRCIDFSRKKVKNYSRQLCSLVQETASLLTGQSKPSDVKLLHELQELRALGDYHRELCSMAYGFRNSSSLEVLSQKHSVSTGSNDWSRLRHYIGRLGSWTRASKVLVRMAKSSPILIGSFRIDTLASPPPIAAPAADSKTTLDSALNRMFPAKQSDLLEQVRETLRNLRVMDVAADFLNAYTADNFRPRIHAELLLLEHFYHYDLDFVDSDRYIGCSKPSCYCCDLYMKFHPGKFVPRACHGNLWVNWRAPIPPTEDKKAAQKHTAGILNEMVKRVRADAIFQITSKQPRRQRVPDSTTGMSTSVARPRMLTETAPNMHTRQPHTVNSPGAEVGNQQTLPSMVIAQSTSRNDRETSDMASLENEMRTVRLEPGESTEDELGQWLDVSDDEIDRILGTHGGVTLRDT